MIFIQIEFVISFLDKNLLDLPSGSICANALTLCELPHCNTNACRNSLNTTFLQENNHFESKDIYRYNEQIWNDSVTTLVISEIYLPNTDASN